MTAPLILTVSHQLGRAEARRRIDGGWSRIVGQLPAVGAACTQRWDGDRLSFDVVAMGQAVGGTVDVLDDAVRIEVRLPALLGMMARGIADRLRGAAGRLLLPRR